MTNNQPPAYIPCHLMDAPASAGADSLTIGTCIISSGVLCYISQCEDGFHSACHQRNKQVLCLSCHQSLLLSVIPAPLKPPLRGPSSSWEREVPQIFELRPLIGPPTVPLPEGDKNTDSKGTVQASQCWFP